MSIIIKTPRPDTEERLVLVPALHALCPSARDATAADLARGGWVPSVGYLPRREVETAVSDAMDLQRRLDRMTEVAEQNRERFETAETELSADTIRADAWKAKAIKAEADLGVAESANEEAGELLAAETARAEAAEGLLVQRETELRLAREDGDERARDLRQAYERAVAAAEKAERERDEALGRAQSETEWRVRAVSERQDAEVERDTLRAELARLTAPGAATEAQYREQSDFDAGVAHERARQQPAKGRATDEELVGVYTHGYDTLAHETRDPFSKSHYDCKRAAVAAVAARVRQERCLVAQAVGMGADLHVVAHGGADERQVTVAKGRHMQRAYPDAAEVPATLARLLGEVSRG